VEPLFQAASHFCGVVAPIPQECLQAHVRLGEAIRQAAGRLRHVVKGKKYIVNNKYLLFIY
jgi:hypothetical protein